MTREEQIDRTLAYAQRDHDRRRGYRIGSVAWIAVALYNRRLWLAGDVFLVPWTNGACRWPIVGVSSRGYPIGGLHVGISKEDQDIGGRQEVTVHEVVVPGEAADADVPLSHPGLRQTIVGLARQVSAARVGASSPSKQRGGQNVRV